ncbi:3'-to-5' exoribonuclease RNase R [Minicystis rosea]|nr:3'-to-5' exoribonuclease RNase R [Minicystis rosea]
MLLLRAMKQAVYDVVNVGHFGLASPAYLHFTSPIRRYPDLLVHRAVKAALRGEHIDRTPEARDVLRNAAVTASECERKAMDVEREVVDLYRALYMRDHIGAIYEGTVTGIVGTGVFVNVDDPFIDVLVRMESLGPDRYEIDEEGLRVIGTRSGDRIAIGDRMMVQVDDVSILRRTVYGRRAAGLEMEVDGEPPKKRAKREVKRTARTTDRPARATDRPRAARTTDRPRASRTTDRPRATRKAATTRKTKKKR